MRVALAQINTTIGDLENNVKKIGDFIKKAKAEKADIVVFPELAITGYPPKDLLLRKDFVKKNEEFLKDLIKNTSGIFAVVGFVESEGNNIYNSAAIFGEKKLIGVVRKKILRTYDFFDEKKYFKPGKNDGNVLHIDINGKRFDIEFEICEHVYDDAVTHQKNSADFIINISASPFYIGKNLEEKFRKIAEKNRIPIFYVNLVGGQDEIVFDGQSLAVDRSGNLIAIGKQFDEDLVIIEIPQKLTTKKIEPHKYKKEGEMFNALVLGLKDYFKKTCFKKAVIGLSGGIDSSLAACIAVEALGKKNVIGVSMPSRFSSDHSRTDAQKLAQNLGICFVMFSIQDIVKAYEKSLEKPLDEIRKKFFISRKNDDPVANENIQSRVRANCLMDISNRLKDLKILVINTGNKTEIALGYCTLYGDMTGGIGVLGDVSKLDVYKLAKYVNEKSGREIIPKNIFLKKPSPELKNDQFDPFDYEIVSPLVDEIIEKRKSRYELIKMGYPGKIVDDVLERIRKSEYKRRQAVPYIKITKSSLIGIKMPIVNKYKE